MDLQSLRRNDGKAKVIDAWAPLRSVLANSTTVEGIEECLTDFVEPLLKAVD